MKNGKRNFKKKFSLNQYRLFSAVKKRIYNRSWNKAMT